MNFKHF